MKLKLVVFFFIPIVVSAQLSYDTLSNGFTYRCNCSESLIVQGTPQDIKYHSKNKNISPFQVQIDTTFYVTDFNSKKDKHVFIVSNSAETSSLIRNSNLFVLKRCFICDAENPTRCRPLLYYEIVSAAKNSSMNLDIIRRQETLIPCVHCQTMRLFKRKNKKWDLETLDKIEKFIDKERRKISNE